MSLFIFKSKTPFIYVAIYSSQIIHPPYLSTTFVAQERLARRLLGLLLDGVLGFLDLHLHLGDRARGCYVAFLEAVVTDRRCDLDFAVGWLRRCGDRRLGSEGAVAFWLLHLVFKWAPYVSLYIREISHSSQ